MHMYQTRKEANWMTKVKSTSSLVMTATPKATSSIILIRGRLSSVEMSFSMKKENGIGDLVMKIATSFQNLKKKHLEKFNKCPTHQHHPHLKTLEVKGL